MKVHAYGHYGDNTIHLHTYMYATQTSYKESNTCSWLLNWTNLA